jgi:addiction module RelB/DinJ family antitoxin
MASTTILFRTRVPKDRLKRAEKILSKIGLKPGEAFNMLLAQVEIREGLPFAVTARPGRILSPEEQANAWNDALGAY